MDVVVKPVVTKRVSPKIYVCRHGERIDFVDQGWWEHATRCVSTWIEADTLFFLSLNGYALFTLGLMLTIID